MTERYSFTVDRHLVPNISVDGSVVWNQEHIIDGVNTTLQDSINEGYVTAEEETQYLSVLDSSNEISLENLNITLTNPKLEVEEAAETFITSEELIEQPSEEVSEQQVVVYSVEGSDEIYGIQIGQDEDGNLQKYQFQYRKNKDGQLEIMPETVQLLPLDEEVIQEETNQETLEMVNENNESTTHHSMHIFVQDDNSTDHILPDPIEEQGEEYEPEAMEEVDIKPGLLSINVKQEIQEQQIENFECPAAESLEEETTESFPEDPQDDLESETVEEGGEGNIEGYNEQIDNNSIASEENSNLSEPMNPTSDTNDDNTLIDQNFEHIEVNPDMDITETNPPEEDNNMNDSDIDDNYQIVEGVHITGDVESGNDVHLSGETISEKTNPINNTNILRHALKANKEQKLKKDNRLYLYVVQHPEKENVDSLSLDMANLCKPVIKANPRSILKSSHAMFQTRNENELTNNESLLNKRFARCKEAVQARIFHNFINKTTIPQAPVRKDRLPRKQKIKPVERMDEEIVVKEVMVSSNGFVETVGEGVNKENLEVVEYVELTDSDDDYDPKRVNKKKKKHKKKKIEITISDESDVSSVIELDETDEEDNNQKSNDNTPTKRRRGRPPKNRTVDLQSENTESPSKKIRTETSENQEKPEIPCPKCDKTFPSQNSLKTHLQHHNLQSSLRNALPEYKYKCEECGKTFINNILLKKHMCSKIYSCSVCKKKFSDFSSLNIHKRTHAKEQLLKTTTVAPVSPKRNKTINPTFKCPKKINSLKCKKCGKLCSSLQNLNIHMKTHKEYICTTCSATFLSQLALEKHLRESCVKSPQGMKRSFRPKSTSEETKEEPSNRVTRLTSANMKATCDNCTKQFPTYQALFKHKVKDHGLETPDKSILENKVKKSLVKEREAYGGITASKRIQSVYANIKCQLDF